MHFIYVDDSGDEKTRAFSALAVPESEWKATLAGIKEYRRELKRKYGIYVTAELHATDFVGGRGRIAPTDVPKGLRCHIYRETLKAISSLPGIRLFNAIAPKAHEKLIFERLLTRINNTMKAWGSNAVIIHDEGKDYTYMVRRMGIYNPIQSKFGTWPNGKTFKNFPLIRVLEDIIFRDSADSYFIQFSDFCAFSLFRNEFPLQSKLKYNIHTAFDELKGICTPECFGKDHRQLGIIREI